MSVDIMLPNINDITPEGQLVQMKSYMYQLVQQLNWALNNITPADVVVAGDQTTGRASAADLIEDNKVDIFNSIKSMIIKSADIVQAYYDTMKVSLDGAYVAQSDYGEFVQKTNATIDANSEQIRQNYTNLQAIHSDITMIMETNAWIKTGLLDDTSTVPVYGIEVGQTSDVDGEKVFDKFARFTSEGIYFYLPGSSDAIAWMTGTKLYITSAEITQALDLGGYTLDLSNGIAFKWRGYNNG